MAAGGRAVGGTAAVASRGAAAAASFSAQNLWRMRQFFETYPPGSKLSTLLREVPWSAHLHVLSRTKRDEEREFYLRMTAQQGWQVREVARQIDSGLFERALLNPPKLSTSLRAMQPQAEQHFKDAYLLDFLALPDTHSEADLHRSLLMNLGRFLTELGRDFCYIGSEYPVQVGGQDFALDLLFFHRGLNCLVAIELKVTAFEPEHLGKLNFYLEALDRDVKKPHENPAHRRAAVRQQGRRGGGVRAEPHTLSRAGGAVPDPASRQAVAGGQAARVLCVERTPRGAAGPRAAGSTKRPQPVASPMGVAPLQRRPPNLALAEDWRGAGSAGPQPKPPRGAATGRERGGSITSAASWCAGTA